MEQKILVTIACYNHGKYLQQSINSIQTQTWKNLDIAIVNDGSDPEQKIDEIVEMMSRSDERIRYKKFERNMGKWQALNYAMSTSDAKFFTSHDADDVSLPDRISRQIRCLLETGTVHNLCGFHHCYSDDEIAIAEKIPKFGNKLSIIDPETVRQLVIQGYQTPGINHYFTGNFETAGVTSMFYRSLFDYGLRFNPPDVGLRILNSEDSDFNFRATMFLGSTSILAERQYCYRRHTSTNNEKK